MGRPFRRRTRRDHGAINASIGFDKRMARQDIEGSRAHAAMLAAQGIITDTDAEAIREGLLTVLSEIEGGFRFSTALRTST